MDNQTTLPTTAPAVASDRSKKPYSAPRLSLHGTVAELTQKIGTHPDVDQGGSFNPQTN